MDLRTRHGPWFASRSAMREGRLRIRYGVGLRRLVRAGAGGSGNPPLFTASHRRLRRRWPLQPGTDRVWCSGAGKGDQLAPLPLDQTAKCLRVSDPTVGKDASGLDRADLRQHQEDIAHSRCPHTRGWVGEDLHQLDRSRGELLLQLRSRRPNFVRLLQRTQPLLARSARNARTGTAL